MTSRAKHTEGVITALRPEGTTVREMFSHGPTKKPGTDFPVSAKSPFRPLPLPGELPLYRSRRERTLVFRASIMLGVIIDENQGFVNRFYIKTVITRYR